MAQQITQQISFLKWPITSTADMLTAYQELTDDHGYRGSISFANTVESPDIKIHQLQLAPDDTGSVVARVGDVIVLMAGSLESLSQADYNTKYGGS
jgi:hypothetical protein